MRVLFVTHNFPRSAGDLPGNFLLRLALALREVGVEVHAFAPHAAGLADSGEVDGIAVTRFRYAPEHREVLAYGGTMAAQVAGSWIARADLLRLIRAAGRAAAQHAQSADVVHAHWWFPSALGVTRQRGLRLPVVTTLHGSDVRFAARSLPGRLMMRRTLRRSRRVTAVSNYLASEARRIAGVAPLVAPMPADVQLFSPAGAERDGLLFVGKLDAQKGLDVLVEAMPLLDRAVTLTVVGDGIEAVRLRAQAAALGVGDRITWAGQQPQQLLPAYYRSARLVVAPAVAPEGLGLTGVEAQLCETPVIASDLGGHRDVVAHEHTGLLVPPRDARALATAITGALAGRERLAEWGREGRARMLDRFGPAAAARAYAAVYREAIGEHA